MAASATLALKAGACVRRVRFVIVAPDPRHSRRSQAGFPLNELSEFGRPPLIVDRGCSISFVLLFALGDCSVISGAISIVELSSPWIAMLSNTPMGCLILTIESF